MKESIESFLTRKYKGLRHDQAVKLVAKCRSRLEMPENAEWNNQLLLECERKMKAWRERSKKKKVERLRAKKPQASMISSKVVPEQPGDTTSATSESDERQRVKAKKPPKPSTSQENPGLINSFFDMDLSRHREDDTIDRFFGKKVNKPTSSRRPSLRKSFSSGKRIKEMAMVASKKQIPNHKHGQKESDRDMEMRVHHLVDSTARLMPLEALMLRRFNMKLEDASCLVADARMNINASKWEPWTDQLYIECERLYEEGYKLNSTEGDTQRQRNKIQDWSDFYHEGSTSSARSKAEQFSFAASVNNETSGWESASGWASLFSDNHGTFSVTTHDRDDEYCVGLIQKLGNSIAYDPEDIHHTRRNDTIRSTTKGQESISETRESGASSRRKKKKRCFLSCLLRPFKATNIHV